MELYNQTKLHNVDDYHAAQALTDDYMYRNDAQAETILDKLFTLIALFEESDAAPPTSYEELDFDEYDDIRDWT